MIPSDMILDTESPTEYINRAAQLLVHANKRAESIMAAFGHTDSLSIKMLEFFVELAKANALLADRVHNHRVYLEWKYE